MRRVEIALTPRRVLYSYVPSLLPVTVRTDVMGSVDPDVSTLNYFHVDVIK